MKPSCHVMKSIAMTCRVLLRFYSAVLSLTTGKTLIKAELNFQGFCIGLFVSHHQAAFESGAGQHRPTVSILAPHFWTCGVFQA